MRYHPDYGTLHPETGKQAKLAMPVKKISLYDCFIRRQNPQRAGKPRDTESHNKTHLA